VHIKVEDSSSGEDTDGTGGGGGGDGEEATGGEGDKEVKEVEEEDEEEDEEEREPRDQRAHEPGASLKGGSEAVRPQIPPPGAHSEPWSLQPRLRTPWRLADNAVQDNEVR
jgi:hypothetical protein